MFGWFAPKCPLGTWEKTWIETIHNLDDTTTFDMESAMVQYFMNDDETLAGLLEAYAEVGLESWPPVPTKRRAGA